MAHATHITLGDRFVRPEDPETIWIVERLVELPGLPLHAKLLAENRRCKTMTMSEVALLNRKLYLQVEDNAQEAA